MTYREYEDKIAQLRWERDLAIQQLKGDYGVGLGEVKDPDIVKVVHCKDCKHYVTDDIIPNYCNYHTNKVGFCDDAVYMGEYDFCSCGEEEKENDEF